MHVARVRFLASALTGGSIALILTLISAAVAFAGGGGPNYP